MSAQSEMQCLAELDQLAERVEELLGLLEDEKATNVFLSGLVQSYAYAEIHAPDRCFTPEQLAFINDQYPDAPEGLG